MSRNLAQNRISNSCNFWTLNGKYQSGGTLRGSPLILKTDVFGADVSSTLEKYRIGTVRRFFVLETNLESEKRSSDESKGEKKESTISDRA